MYRGGSHCSILCFCTSNYRQVSQHGAAFLGHGEIGVSYCAKVFHNQYVDNSNIHDVDSLLGNVVGYVGMCNIKFSNE